MKITLFRNRLLICVVSLAACCFWKGWGVSAAFALQPSSDTDGAEAGAESGESPSGASVIQDQGISLKVRRIGVGDKARPGDWAGFQLEVTEQGLKSRDVIVQVEIPDADGDRALMRRSISTTAGQTRSVWLYGWLPRGSISNTIFHFAVYEAIPRDADPSVTGVARYSAGKPLALRVIQPARSGIAPTSGLIGVIGVSSGGLEQYSACRDGSGNTPTGHEITEIAQGLRPDDLPDCWQGLMPFEALVWTGRGGDFEPSDIKDVQAAALREWIRRGGHLVIVLPSVGQSWYGSINTANPIGDLLPVVTPTLMEGVDLNMYRRMLTNDREVTFGGRKDAAVYRLDPGAWGRSPGPFEAMPILVGPTDEPVVVRRLVGAGAVTVVGIDTTRRDLAAKDALEADVFWNRILGKRLELISQNEYNDRFNGVGPNNVQRQPKYRADRPVAVFDDAIPERINKTISAVKGLLMAFVMFTTYWLLAGPVGFFVLKQRRRIQHAWVVFFAIAGAFTLVGWAGARVLRMGRDADKHLTIIDQVYGQPSVRMRSWVELTLTSYGEERVSVAPPRSEVDAGAPDWHNTLAAWQAAGNSNSLGSFPDARGYTVDARSPDTIEFPARATTRQIQVDYAGATPTAWGMPRPVVSNPEEVPIGSEVWIEELSQAQYENSNRKWRVHGVLTHSLPAALHDVLVVVNLGQAPYARIPGSMLAEAYQANLKSSWAPNQPLDIEDLLGPRKLSELALEDALTSWRGKEMQGAYVSLDAGHRDFVQQVYGQAFFSMLTPPNPSSPGAEFRATRESTQTMDLGRWFTQPCIIVIGILGDKSFEPVECPVPISVDGVSGETVRKEIKGTTVIRWVYPLKPRPPSPDRLVMPLDPGGTESEKSLDPADTPGVPEDK